MMNLIDEYIKRNKRNLSKIQIFDSELSSTSKIVLINNNIRTVYDLLISEHKLKKIFCSKPQSLDEIEDYIFSLKSDITDELDCFPQLEEWDMFLEALNEVIGLDPLTCILCGENPSAYSINLADNESINICYTCAETIRKNIYRFLNERELW